MQDYQVPGVNNKVDLHGASSACRFQDWASRKESEDRIKFCLFLTVTVRVGRVTGNTTYFCFGPIPYSNCSQKSFWNIGDDDSDEEDDGVEPVVAEDEGDDEEGDAEEDSDSGDEVDEMSDLTRNRGLVNFQTRCQVSNSPHDGPVASEDHNATSSS